MTMFPIASYTFPGGTTYAQFNNIPQNFTHLHIRTYYLASTTGGVGAGAINLGNNGTYVDGGSNYSNHHFWGNNYGGSGTQGYSNQSVIPIFWPVSTNSSYPTFSIIDIYDYTNTNKNKIIKSFYGTDQNGAGEVGTFSGMWMNTAAINCIGIGSGQVFTAGSRIDVYGVTSS